MRRFIVALALLVTSTVSHAKSFGEHGGYDVGAVETTGETSEKGDRGFCAMQEEFKGPGSTRLTLVRNIDEPDLIYVLVDNWNWSITKGTKYEGVT